MVNGQARAIVALRDKIFADLVKNSNRTQFVAISSLGSVEAKVGMGIELKVWQADAGDTTQPAHCPRKNI